jgi:FAD/FMN-containing dehydrogenase
MQACAANHVFHNWAQTITCKPADYCQPTTENEVGDIVKSARAARKHVRTVGGGHSWSPLVLTQDVLVNLDLLQRVNTDVPNLRAQAQAGIRLKDLTPRLAQDTLALANLGSIREQSIAGAISTGTHGTGLGLGSLSTQIVGVRLVTGTGEFLSITKDDSDLLNAARVSLGGLGIITEVTIQCVKDYDLEYTAYVCKFADALKLIDGFNQKNTRVRLWWLVPPFGSRETVLITTMNPPGTGGVPTGDSVLPMDLGGLFTRFGQLLHSPSGCTQFLRFKGHYDQILTVPLLPVLHRECEYAIPVEKTVEALESLKRVIDEGDLSLTLPIEVRFVGKDESLLSPANGRDVCYIGSATQPNANEVFERFEPLLKVLGGRPHWGKCFSITRSEVEAMYSGTYDKFCKIRKDLDPDRVFTNELIRQYFD